MPARTRPELLAGSLLTAFAQPLGNSVPHGSLDVFESVCWNAPKQKPPSSLDLNGIDLTPVQDTPVASRKEDTYVHFNVDIELQKHVEKLTKGVYS